ncbi:MAG TPA: hypothetical protein VE046_08085 [Steroidobacteraceae bacterium]|nr:hypothetical protein [Steroidobacteraceae bacterium]
MKSARLKYLVVAIAILCLAACATSTVNKPAPPVPSATPLPAPASTPAPAKDPVSGTPSTKSSTGSPAPTGEEKDKNAKTGESSTSNPGDPQTSEERRVAVAKRLDDSLGTWDETLRKEQSDLAKSREQRAEDTAKTAEKNGEGVEDVDADAGVDPDKYVAKNGDLKSEAEASKDPNGKSTDNGAAHQGDVGEGRVDDIVGRQICEAARQETDPELKEKLQKECQKYRDGSH